MSLIDYERLSNGLVLTQPMHAAVFDNLLPPAVQQQLSMSYPTDGFKKNQRLQPPGKLYSFSMLPLVEDGQINQPMKNNLWANLIDSLLDPRYRHRLAEVLSIDLSDVRINIGLYQYDKDDYVDIHLDHANKRLTQIFYFNTDWAVNDGGFLHLLKNQHQDSSFLRLPPISMYSVVIVQSDAAWHAVEPVTALNGRSRFSLQLEFYQRD